MFEVIQWILILIGAIFIIKGIVNVSKGYNIDKVIAMFINIELTKIKNEKRK